MGEGASANGTALAADSEFFRHGQEEIWAEQLQTY